MRPNLSIQERTGSNSFIWMFPRWDIHFSELLLKDVCLGQYQDGPVLDIAIFWGMHNFFNTLVASEEGRIIRSSPHRSR